MKKIVLSVLLLVFSQPAYSMEFSEARNILSKTSFGVVPDEIDNLVPLSYSQGIEKILKNNNRVAKLAPPTWVNQEILKVNKKGLTQEEKKQIRKKINNQGLELKTWWYREMATTNSPITERMTLFWHNHFTSSIRKVRYPVMMYKQNVLLRKYSLGNFREMLHEISKDPAMILYLDNQSNRKGKPNENFAREVMELFTLGEGNYTEKDIKEGARAFTGWKVNIQTGEYQFNKKMHDAGSKEFFGKKGNFDGDHVLDMILEKTQVSVYITQKLWKEFISDKPEPKEVERIAAVFRKNYEIKDLMREILNSKYFRDKNNFANMVKSPVELIVGTIREFNIPIEDNNKNIQQIVRYGARLGQDVFTPPNVKGWVGGNSWITSATLPARQQLLQRLTRGNEPFSLNYQQKHLANLPSGKIESLWTDDKNSANELEKIKKIVLPIEPITPITEKTNKMNYVRKIVLDPVYELK